MSDADIGSMIPTHQASQQLREARQLLVSMHVDLIGVLMDIYTD